MLIDPSSSLLLDLSLINKRAEITPMGRDNAVVNDKYKIIILYCTVTAY